MKTRKDRIEIGDNVEFTSGSYQGLTGEITDIDYNAKYTPYGLKCKVLLSNGSIDYIEKSEHWRFIK